jgi:ethanolamine utilization protein EutL
MAILDPVKPKILAARLISSVHPDFAKQLKLRDDQHSVGLLTCDIDDCLYVSLDEATKMAEVEIVYAHSFYAGAGYPSGPLSGEIIGIMAGPNPAEVRAGMDAAIAYAEEDAWFRSANEDDSLVFFAHTLSRTGSYLSKEAGVDPGTPLAYLIAPPLEATWALDAAVKAADVEMKVWWAPPSETNFSGGMLAGTQSACRAACQAFTDAVLDVASGAMKY